MEERLARELNIDKVLADLMVQRGITTFEEAKKFFRPRIEDLHDPFLMKDMDKAVKRLEQALQNNENILVYGDYDVDGTTAVALVYLFLHSFYQNITYYIPDRYAEGYGISFQGVDFALDNDFSLIIALDCGIKANDKIDYANERNIDFIICDHHLPGDQLPDAVAVLDPKRNDCTYPFKELSGCGIGFKLVQAYAQKNNIPFENLMCYLDLTAISIAADIVPMVDENRVLAYYGIKQLNKNPRPGVKAILKMNKFKRELNITDVVFVLGPRINAAGRIASGKNAVEMLISDTMDAAETTGKIINQNNLERRDLDVLITRQALEMIDEDVKLINRKTTVLFHPEWHKGVIGIVASRLTEKYYRPTIMLAAANGKVTGSARSVKDFDVYKAIEACSDLLEQFGGHKYAAGLTLKLENMDAFAQRFEKVVSDTIEEHMLIPRIEIDARINLSDINPKFCRILKQFSPFGPENMTPVFLSEGVIDKGYAKLVGTNHLKLDITDPDNPNISYAAIAFNQGEHLEYISKKIPFNVCYTIEENEWNSNVSLQLNVKDIKF